LHSHNMHVEGSRNQDIVVARRLRRHNV
jgi:hypothetical protein